MRMSRSRRDPHKAKRRRERIRREKEARRADGEPQEENAPSPLSAHPFAAERSSWEVHTILEGQNFSSIEEINEQLAGLAGVGRISEMASRLKKGDPKWKAQQLAYDAMEADDVLESLRLATRALDLDPECTDAQRLIAGVLPEDRVNRIALMREVVATAERNLGEELFEEGAGHFWGNIKTRPYMRALHELGEMLLAEGQTEEGIEIFERMLDLNDTDNQGIRYQLLPLLFADGQARRASRLMARFPNDEKFSASFSWGRVLERWLSGDFAGAKKALGKARKINRHVEAYITGERRLAGEAPAYYKPGDDSEARVCAQEFERAWRAHWGFGAWLLEQR